jgi:phosphoglycolate phosphatase
MCNEPKQAVLFDLDGTLLDTVDDLADCMNAAVTGEGCPASPVEKHKLMVGDGVANYVLRALPEDRRADKELIQRVTRKYRELYSRSWAIKTRPYDGIEEMLEALTRKGLRLAVLSNKPDGFTREMVGHFLGRFKFDVVRGAVEDMPLKPDPSAALAIAAEMGIEPSGFLYVGDTATDMKTALAAGMFAVGALWGFRTRQELEAAGAKALIERPTQLLDWICQCQAD